jgi:4-carboxymuconolactone decarboxylase
LSNDRYERGMAVRKSVLGAEHVARAEANKTEFDADFQQFITESVWGDVWSRPGLELKTRQMITMGILAVLGRHEELGNHIRATRHTGVTPDEIKEIFLQVAVYAGAPAANSAFALAKRVYQEMDKENK